MFCFSLKYILAVRREKQERCSLSFRDPCVSPLSPRDTAVSPALLQLLLMAIGVRHGAGDGAEQLSPLLEGPVAQWIPPLRLVPPFIEFSRLF